MDIDKHAQDIGLSPEEYRDLVRLFLNTAEGDLSKLKEAIKTANHEQAAAVAHHIKGAALNLELDQISKAALAIETNAKQKNLAGAEPNIEIIRGELKAIAQSINQV